MDVACSYYLFLLTLAAFPLSIYIHRAKKGAL